MAACIAVHAFARQSAAPEPSLATVSTQGVSVSGSLSVAGGRATIGNDGTITAGEKTADVTLTRGGNLKVCASTKIHLSTDNSVDTATPGGALMIAVDRGALEAHYTPGQYSDVILTPDLRILISPPGQADLRIRVNNQGDTCVDNHGDAAPYVLAAASSRAAPTASSPTSACCLSTAASAMSSTTSRNPAAARPINPRP